MKPFLLSAWILIAALADGGTGQLNFLLIVADDLNYDSVGYVSGIAPDVTPHIDQLAAQSLSFEKAFSVASVCQPSRQSMLSGLFPHNYGSKGFFPMGQGIPTLPSLLKESGYLTGSIHKLSHMLPEESFNWDYDNKRLGLNESDAIVGRDPEAISRGLRKFIKHADNAEKPFFMVVNSADPHRPFHGDPLRASNGAQPKVPSRVYQPDEVSVPPALPDLPGIREDLAKYASSVRRLDDTVGACLKVLDDLQKESSTLVIFVSDNGMSFPFGKFDCYLGSNRSPLLLRCPQLFVEPMVFPEALVSLMDITPTVLELANVPVPERMDGRSLVPFIESHSADDWRESIVFLRNEDIYYGGEIRRRVSEDPEFIAKLEARGWKLRPDHRSDDTFSRDKEIRCYYDGRFGYIYNHWYRQDGLEFSPLGATIPYDSKPLKVMEIAAQDDSVMKNRYEFYILREKEELYDWAADPGSLHNLAGNPNYAEVMAAARKGLLQWMLSSDDPLADAYRKFAD